MDFTYILRMTTDQRPITRHLDLGCGDKPRNPYQCDELHGIDIFPRHEPGSYEIRKANLSLEPIPYPDNYFDSVSAYDFFEHVPRVLSTADGLSTRFPFIELMNEIWRVLKPNGVLYASTPCYPYQEVFQDPTHVNFLTLTSHDYFTRPKRLAAMYGFAGDFSAKRVLRYAPKQPYEPIDDSWRQKFRTWNRERRNKISHVLWEFVANK
jgi:SAM-dependent methyltransferase